ncbi:MAG: glutamate synthase [Bdellovibrionales bacterium GWA2_49_15]|nr:MAG: glutamate synthase [Bdellovibrionales bacterium GWA2_49_15]HAZ14462.1 FMN-binding glutamate synthase family protein [Bdellovibrionales bacterium]
MRRQFTIFSIITFVLIFGAGTLLHPYFFWAFILFGPLYLLGVVDMCSTHHSIIANWPIGGRFRYFMEVLRPKIYQYFVESDTDGAPISRIFRNVVYQRAKKALSSAPFGTQLDVYQVGYEWINHSIYPSSLKAIKPDDLRITIGGKDCTQPYSASIYNISAMSFGALSKNAVLALSQGAKHGGFYHNTGEGGLSPYHLKGGGNLVWQIGTGYFGCRDEDGNFCEKNFIAHATLPNVKMIELKLSQGAKPGHGGILPAGKNTPEIAAIRGVKPWTTVYSPSNHTSFNNSEGLLKFVARLRTLSGGKPTGFKLCIGHLNEFEDICKAMVKTEILPDFITIDGGEGGTGAAPLEFSNSVGTPLREGLIGATNLLTAYKLRDKLKVIASGKILTGFDLVKYIALGADACNTARGMMLALGCIQAMECNKNTCPTGVATQDSNLAAGLNVQDKHVRVANFHHETVEAVAEIIAATGLSHTRDLRRHHIWRRVTPTNVQNYEEIFPYAQSL